MELPSYTVTLRPATVYTGYSVQGWMLELSQNWDKYILVWKKTKKYSRTQAGDTESLDVSG